MCVHGCDAVSRAFEFDSGHIPRLTQLILCPFAERCLAARALYNFGAAAEERKK